MTLLTTPGWLQNVGATHSAAEFRSYIGSLLAGTRSSATDLLPLGGVHPGMGGEFNVTQTGSPSMAVQVASGAAWVPGTEGTTQGTYAVLNDATVTVAISPAHVSLARIDLVVIRIRDSFYSGGDDDAEITVITGTPASDPVPPSLPNNVLILAEIEVGASVTTIGTSDITQKRRYLNSVGGVFVHTLAADLWTGDNITEGQMQYARDTDTLYIWDGTTNLNVWQKTIEGSSRLPRGIMANPTVASTSGTATSGTNEVRDAVLGNYVFTSEGTDRRYRVTFTCAAYTSDTGTRVLVKIRDGLGSTPTTSSTLLVERFGLSSPAGIGGRRGINVIGTFTASAGTHTLSVFWQGYDSGVVTPASGRELFVEDIGKVY